VLELHGTSRKIARHSYEDDVLLDATETQANPSVLACVRRAHLQGQSDAVVNSIARRLGTTLIA